VFRAPTLKRFDDFGTLAEGAETLVLPNGHGLTSPQTTGRFYVGSIYPASKQNPLKAIAAAVYEEVLIYSITGDDASVIRGWNGTTDIDHIDGGEAYRIEFLNSASTLRSLAFLNVESFGVSIDNDGDENQAALDRLLGILPSSRWHLFFPSGEYLVDPTTVTGRFVLNGFTNFCISGYGAVLKVRDGNAMRASDYPTPTNNLDGIVLQSCVDGRIEGLTWDGNLANRVYPPVDQNDVTPNHNFDVQDSCRRIDLVDCTSIGAAADGFAVQASARETLATLPFDINVVRCRTRGATRVGFSTFNCHDVLWDDCLAEDGYEGFDCESDTAATPPPYVPGARDITWRRCKSRGNTGAGMSVGSGKYTTTPKHDFTQGLRIIDCEFDGRNAAGTATGPAKLTVSRVRDIQIIGTRFLYSTIDPSADQGVLTIRSSADVKLDHLHFEGNNVTGKRAIRIDSECARVTMSHISAPDHTGSHCIESAGVDTLLEDSIISADAGSDPTPLPAYGVNGNGASRMKVARVTVLQSRGTGIRLDQDDASVEDCDVANNRSDGSTINYGIFLVGDRAHAIRNRIPQPNDLSASTVPDTTRHAVRTNGDDVVLIGNWAETGAGKYDIAPAIYAAGSTQYRAGNVGDSSSGNPRAPVWGFYYDDIPANLTAGDTMLFSAGAISTLGQFLADTNGWIRSIGLQLSDDITAGTITARVRINGTTISATYNLVLSTSDPRRLTLLINSGLVPFSAGDRLDMAIYSDSSLLPDGTLDAIGGFSIEYAS